MTRYKSYAKDKLKILFYVFVYRLYSKRTGFFVRRETAHSHSPDPSAYQKKEAIQEAIANPYKSGMGYCAIQKSKI